MAAKKTVCFINTATIWGGGEAWQYETILDLSPYIQAVSIAHPKGILFRKLNERDEAAVLPFTAGNLSFLNPFKILAAYRLFKKWRPHAVLFNTSNDFKLFSLPAKWAGVRYRLYRRDNGKPLRNHPLNKCLLRQGISHFVPCSQFIARAALSAHPHLFPRSKIDVIYNSIHVGKWDAAQTNPMPITRNPDTLLFGCIGRLSPEKGQLLLPEIAAILEKHSHKFKILIAGTGPLLENLKTAIAQYDSAQRIELLGYVESNKAFLETVDCLLIPSRWEGLSTVAIEAMASRKPIIAFDVAGNPEVVQHGRNGYLAKPYSPEEMALYMLRFIQNPNTLQVMGENGRAFMEDRFTKEKTDSALMKYFS